MPKYLFLALSLFFGFNVLAQKNLAWPVLAMTNYSQDPATGLYTPQFPKILEDQFEGQEVIIAGYLIPVDVEANTYALSKNPFSSCFFCGNAGPETVIELKFTADPGRFATDKYLPIKGTLKLNRNGSGLFFTLENAEISG
ncbi:DUF3299 domain-containing protein [Croceimicrobium hydrocarbonivorans]|uniref:DUF3299 domain-containing protein n=1 Tax=Croceimicrobium hydrocarbonivorans TaxID=2761580 RepID=A0A7H0VFI1_9FLAO|nr:DUF3299 domain-containing protein [Croceimicrobium hydrocarbonivorans]QNR24479.1 DUF3299 domain-containing protein [Croceimicrobium hydrocarbonivorans]